MKKIIEESTNLKISEMTEKTIEEENEMKKEIIKEEIITQEVETNDNVEVEIKQKKKAAPKKTNSKKAITDSNDLTVKNPIKSSLVKKAGTMKIGKGNILTLNANERYSQKNIQKETIEEIIQHIKGEIINTAKVVGLEEHRTANGRSACFILNRKGYKVIIPEELFYFKEEKEEIMGKNKNLINERRIDTEVSYIIERINLEDKIILGNRIKARTSLMKNFFFKTDSNGEYVISNGRIIQCKVVTVDLKWIIVEIFGIEKRIMINELEHQFIEDARTHFRQGQIINVKVMSIDRDIKNKEILSLEVSAKNAKEDPKNEAFSKYQLGGIYKGVVAGIDTKYETGIYVRLEGIDVLCQAIMGRIVKTGDEATIVISGKSEERKKLRGIIKHIY